MSDDQDETMFIFLLFILIGVFLVILTFYSATEEYASQSDIIGLMLISIFVMVVGFLGFLVGVKAMPLRIYEAGFTLYWVGVIDGWRRRETLVPRDKIMVVDIVERKYGEYILVRYDDGPLTSATRYLDTFTESIALERLKALHRIAGRKFTNRARAYLGKGF